QERDQIFVIIVGDFHNAYQDGLVARLRARGEHRVLSISQVDIEGMTNEEAIAEIAPDPEWGVRADFVWSN
ncbi:MAG: iron-regulated protein, partial [Bdellovibrionales bacterium]|nr:iron-regulated protein [Bdellovibrionales bacterium]